MTSFNSLTLSVSFLIFSIHFTYTQAATFNIQNNCLYTVWAAAKPGGGGRLDRGQTWILNLPPGNISGRVWARTGCNFDGSGRGKCMSGDCDGLLGCEAEGAPPVTLAEYTLNGFGNTDFYDLSLVNGFNVPMEFSPISNGCTRGIKCAADINDQCPDQLRDPGGCHNPCTVFNTTEYCCDMGDCKLTNYTKPFKDGCPDAYGYARDDDMTTMFTCPTGTNYKVVFCPENSSLDRTVSFLLVCD